MALSYKLEYNVPNTYGDDSVYIHLKKDVPFYISQIGKEDYAKLPTASKNAFITGIFNINGVVEVASQAFRLWVMKSPVYSWLEVNTPLLSYLATALSESGTTQLPGSAQPDGTGFRLTSEEQRRAR